MGRPIPTIPVKGVRGTYGPPKPIPVPHGPPGKYGFPHPPSHGPPRRGYGPPKPNLSGVHGKPFISGPPNYEGGFSKPFGPVYSQPIDKDAPYEFEPHSQKDKRVEVVVTAQGGAAGNAGTQEHIHHHYHHNLGENKPPTVVVNNPIPAAVAAAAEAVQGSSFIGSQGSLYKPSSGFSPTLGFQNGIKDSSSGFSSGIYGGQSIAGYGGSSSSGLGSFGNLKPVSETYSPQTFGSSYAPNSFGTSVGSFGSSDFYKKELSVNGIQSNSLSGEQYLGSESARAENYDCVCVPYDQCPSRDIIGRKDDLYLPLDPRNLKSDITADEIQEERVITDGNGTMTVVRVPKDTNTTLQEESEEGSKKVKREAPASKDGDSKIEAVSIKQVDLYYICTSTVY